MHAVILKKRKNPVYPGCQVNQKCYSYILCHVRKVKYKKGGPGDETGEIEEISSIPQMYIKQENEEVKVAKSGNKRGRPRKNPLNMTMENNGDKIKRGRKPKKVYDINPDNSKIRLDMNFNDSDDKNDNSEPYDMMNSDFKHEEKGDSPGGVISKNFKQIEINNYAVDNPLYESKNGSIAGTPAPLYGRKDTIDNPFDKFFSLAPHNYDYAGNEHRMRRLSSSAQPYNIPSNPPNIASPIALRGNPMNPGDINSKMVLLQNTKHNQMNRPDENPYQQKLNEIIAQSFNSWNNKPKRKDTDDIDFSGQENSILKRIGNGNGQINQSPFDIISNSIMSPDYKPRSFSINSNGWTLGQSKQAEDNRQRGWDFDKAEGNNQDNGIRIDNDVKQNSLIFNSTNLGTTINNLNIIKNVKINTAHRKNTIVDISNEKKKESPLLLPKFNAAFQPFKKRSQSFHQTSHNQITVNDSNSSPENPRKRDLKAEQKKTEL